MTVIDPLSAFLITNSFAFNLFTNLFIVGRITFILSFVSFVDLYIMKVTYYFVKL